MLALLESCSSISRRITWVQRNGTEIAEIRNVPNCSQYGDWRDFSQKYPLIILDGRFSLRPRALTLSRTESFPLLSQLPRLFEKRQHTLSTWSAWEFRFRTYCSNKTNKSVNRTATIRVAVVWMRIIAKNCKRNSEKRKKANPKWRALRITIQKNGGKGQSKKLEKPPTKIRPLCGRLTRVITPWQNLLTFYRSSQPVLSNQFEPNSVLPRRNFLLHARKMMIIWFYWRWKRLLHAHIFIVSAAIIYSVDDSVVSSTSIEWAN